MEDTIEICAGCGKMPRAIDIAEGYFMCSRCGSTTTMAVSGDDYEKVVTELDQRFHMASQKERMEAAASHPTEMHMSPRKKAAKSKKSVRTVKTVRKAAKKPVKKKAKKTAKKPVRKAAKKKTVKKATKKKPVKKKTVKRTVKRASKRTRKP